MPVCGPDGSVLSATELVLQYVLPYTKVSFLESDVESRNALEVRVTGGNRRRTDFIGTFRAPADMLNSRSAHKAAVVARRFISCHSNGGQVIPNDGLELAF